MKTMTEQQSQWYNNGKRLADETLKVLKDEVRIPPNPIKTFHEADLDNAFIKGFSSCFIFMSQRLYEHGIGIEFEDEEEKENE